MHPLVVVIRHLLATVVAVALPIASVSFGLQLLSSMDVGADDYGMTPYRQLRTSESVNSANSELGEVGRDRVAHLNGQCQGD